MRVPVILLVPSHDHLRRSAEAALEDTTAGLDPGKAPRYPGVEIDAAFAAVPIGDAEPGGSAIERMAPHASPRFAVRGHIEVRHPREIPEKAGEAAIFSDPQVSPILTCGGTPPVGDAAAVAAKLAVAQLHARHLDGRDVALAIVDTGIDLAHVQAKIGHAPKLDAALSWKPPGTPPPAPGAWPLDHGSMCAFDALIAAPQATLLDFPVLKANYPGGGSTMSGTLSAALAAYGYMLGSWAPGAGKGLRKYRALVASNSWGIFHPSWDFPAGHPGRYCDNPAHPFNVQLGALSRAGVDVIFAAGNCGAPCADGRCQGRTKGAIMGASAMEDVLTIAGCDTHDDRVGYSSQGPSIAGMYAKKPDVTGYTHFLGSEAFGTGTPDSGTSAACPVVAGCVAALRASTKIPPRTTLPPARLFDALRASARARPGPQRAWNADYGFGILDPLAAAAALGL